VCVCVGVWVCVFWEGKCFGRREEAGMRSLIFWTLFLIIHFILFFHIIILFFFSCSFRYDKPVEDIMTLSELLAYQNKPKNSTHEAYDRTKGQINKKIGRQKNNENGVGKVDDMFAVCGKDMVAGGIFSGEIMYCVIDSDFTLVDSERKEVIRKYTRDEVGAY
jgi:hypothetical protein